MHIGQATADYDKMWRVIDGCLLYVWKIHNKY